MSALLMVLRIKVIGCLSLLAPLVAVLLVTPAHAQEIAATQPEYDSVLAQALTFHAQGDYEAARKFMERAHELEPSARTLRGLGIVAFAQGQHLSAIRYLDQALASEVKALPAELRTSVEQLHAQIWAQVGYYEIRLEPSSGELLLDGAVPDFYAPMVVVLEPGLHTLSARAEGRGAYALELEAKAGARETLHIVLAMAPAPTVIEKLVPVQAPLALSAPRVDDASTLDWWSPALRYAGIGVGTALVLGGASLWTTGRLRLDQVIDACEETAIGSCTRTEARRRYDDKQIGPLFISSAALVGTGAALLVSVAAIEIYLWRHREHKVHAELSPHAIGLRASF